MIINLTNDELKRVANVLREKRSALEKEMKTKKLEPTVYECCQESVELDNKLISYFESKIERDY